MSFASPHERAKVCTRRSADLFALFLCHPASARARCAHYFPFEIKTRETILCLNSKSSEPRAPSDEQHNSAFDDIKIDDRDSELNRRILVRQFIIGGSRTLAPRRARRCKASESAESAESVVFAQIARRKSSSMFVIAVMPSDFLLHFLVCAFRHSIISNGKHVLFTFSVVFRCFCCRLPPPLALRARCTALSGGGSDENGSPLPIPAVDSARVNAHFWLIGFSVC